MFDFLKYLFTPKLNIKVPESYVPQYEYSSNATTIVLKSEPKAKPAYKTKPVKKAPVVKTKVNKTEKKKPASKKTTSTK